jgi:hypothetical protein
MLTIRYTFDKEFGPGGMDPLSKIIIEDERSQITIENTYLDSWLAALIDTLPRLPTTGHIRVETEEPKPMEIEMAADGSVTMSYQDQRVVAKSRKELELALRSAVSAFLAELEACPDASQNRLLEPIRRFWATTEN